MVADSVNTVEAAESALTEASQSGARYNVVLLDMQLDGTSAFELIHFLRTEPTHVVRYSSTSKGEVLYIGIFMFDLVSPIVI